MSSLACLIDCETEKEDGIVEFKPEITNEKVLSIRRQLCEGRYDIFEKLDVVTDRLLEELLNG